MERAHYPLQVRRGHTWVTTVNTWLHRARIVLGLLVATVFLIVMPLDAAQEPDPLGLLVRAALWAGVLSLAVSAANDWGER